MKYKNVEFPNFATWLIVISRQTIKIGNKVNEKCTKKGRWIENKTKLNPKH